VEGQDPLLFAETARNSYGIDACEYLNTFYTDKRDDNSYLEKLRTVADASGVKSVLIMCDKEGQLGDPDEVKRDKAVDNHRVWLDWAQYLGCSSIRVNAEAGVDVIVENHGGLSGNGAWLADVMSKVDHCRVGTLPDFNGFFRYPDPETPGDEGDVWDKYAGVEHMMPWAKGVSANMREFDDNGDEINTDYRRMLDLVVNRHNYHGYIGIEYEGKTLNEDEGIRASLKLLETIRDELRASRAASIS
jgi:hypothetical protein